MSIKCDLCGHSFEVVVNPQDRINETMWVFNENSSIYRFPVRIIEHEGEDHSTVELVARCKIPQYLSEEDPIKASKLSKKVKKLIEIKAITKPEIGILKDYLTHRKFHKINESDLTLSFHRKWE